MAKQRTRTSAVYTVSVSTEMKDAIEKYCGANGTTAVETIREAIRSKLKLPKSALQMGRPGRPKEPASE